MKYRAIYFDGCNGWCYGELLTEEEVKEKYPDAGPRNGDEILEACDGEVLLILV